MTIEYVDFSDEYIEAREKQAFDLYFKGCKEQGFIPFQADAAFPRDGCSYDYPEFEIHGEVYESSEPLIPGEPIDGYEWLADVDLDEGCVDLGYEHSKQGEDDLDEGCVDLCQGHSKQGDDDR